jgi:hypothetical protein
MSHRIKGMTFGINRGGAAMAQSSGSVNRAIELWGRNAACKLIQDRLNRSGLSME